MDNLDLSAFDTQGGLKITATSRNLCIYSCVITDFAACQDKPVFSDEECAKFIKDNIKLAECKIGIHEVNAVIKTPRVTIGFSLKYDVEVFPSTEAIIHNLIARLDNLEKYRTIHECYYPKWDSLDELKKLPHYQCVEDSLSLNKFTVPLPGNNETDETDQVLSHDGVFYVFGTYADHTMNRCSPGVVSFCNVGNYPRQLSRRDSAVEENRETIDPADTLRKLFNMSQEPCYRFGIGNTSLFIDHYVAAWVMRNFHAVAGRNPVVELVGDTEKQTLLIRIKRLKTPQLTHVLVTDVNGITLVQMPVIRCRSCIINGFELVQN